MGAVACAAALSACDVPPPDDTGTEPRTGTAPAPRPAEPPAAPAPIVTEESAELSRYYRQVQADLLARGLLRTDGGGPDTPFTDTDLVRNFERIAFYDEYQRDGTLTPSDGRQSQLKRWEVPVRMAIEFGASVDPATRTKDRNEVILYARRLARITGHPISVGSGPANFHVFVTGEDDRPALPGRIRQIAPRISDRALDIFRTLPRSIHCLVVALTDETGGSSYTRAIALVRAEHPDLTRRSCYHEELAQGLGLANDSPYARPSIFNDDDEFALLTTHDEMLLTMLYDPRLDAGMSANEARPILRQIARELTGGES